MESIGELANNLKLTSWMNDIKLSMNTNSKEAYIDKDIILYGSLGITIVVGNNLFICMMKFIV